jgi:8-oxo-dGTP pyrophosphatase MutT (NUDIX family)
LTDIIHEALGLLHFKISICMNKIICSGALFYSLETKRFLFLHRTKGKTKNLWGLVGGTNEGAETPWEGLKREIDEEIGKVSNIKKTIPLETFISSDNHFSFHTYLCVIDNEFIPKLNDEHNGYAWVTFGAWPKPLHNGLNNTLRSKTNQKKLDTVIKLVDMIA